MNKNKIYPVTGYDDHGIKFYFDLETKASQKKHLTIRFAGNPMLLLEYLFIYRWGTNFTETYESVKLPHTNTPNTVILKQCAKETKELMEVLSLMSDNRKSPFVIYINDYSEYR